MKVQTQSTLDSTLMEPAYGTLVVMRLANGRLTAWRRGNYEGGRGIEYCWWQIAERYSSKQAESWIEVQRSGTILAIFTPEKGD